MSVVARTLGSPLSRVSNLRATLIVLAAPLLLLAVLTAAQAAFGDRVLPRVRVAGVDLGGLSRREARARLASATSAFGQLAVRLRIGEGQWTSTNDELGIVADVDEAVDRASRLGRERLPGDRLGSWVDALLGRLDLGLPRRAKGDALDAFLAGIALEVDRSPVEGSVTVTADGVRVVEPRDGARLLREAVAAEILGATDLGSRDVAIGLAPVRPVIGPDALSEARVAATAAYAYLRLAAGGESVVIEPARLAALVRIAAEPDEAGTVLRPRVEDTPLDALVAELARRFEKAPRDASLVPGGARLEVVPSRNGVTLDRDALRAALADALFVIADGERIVRLAPKVSRPAFTSEAAEELAATLTLVGQSTTSFTVNAARATNIGLGASRFDGLLLQPGESFSFWGRIGEVSLAAGFVEAGAIIEGRSDKALGGGLCQVSTTLFNAVARAGYRIDERHPHAYYIERYPIGLDAAVFSPYEDLRWTNDTAAPVYVRSAATATSVTFWLYSAPTGRTVSFTASERNLVDPGPDQRADPAYPAGYVVRGRDVVATRVVVVNGTVIGRDTWESHYAPVWGGPATTLSVH